MQHQSFICSLCSSGVYRSLQQSYSISSQDVLMAMDYCEESLQEIDITSFLHTLCGHIRVFREHGKGPGWARENPKPSRSPATFIIGECEEDRAEDRAAMASSSRYPSVCLPLCPSNVIYVNISNIYNLIVYYRWNSIH